MQRKLSVPALLLMFMLPAFTMPADARNKADDVYLVTSAQSHMFEISFGKMLMSNSTNPRVQDFGRMLIDHHSKALRKLEDETRGRRLSLPGGMSNEQQRALSLFSRLRGASFDAAVAGFAVADHMGAIEAAETELQLGEASEIKDLASDSLPILEDHLNAAMGLVDSLGSYSRY